MASGGLKLLAPLMGGFGDLVRCVEQAERRPCAADSVPCPFLVVVEHLQRPRLAVRWWKLPGHDDDPLVDEVEIGLYRQVASSSIVALRAPHSVELPQAVSRVLHDVQTEAYLSESPIIAFKSPSDRSREGIEADMHPVQAYPRRRSWVQVQTVQPKSSSAAGLGAVRARLATVDLALQ